VGVQRGGFLGGVALKCKGIFLNERCIGEVGSRVQPNWKAFQKGAYLLYFSWVTRGKDEIKRGHMLQVEQ
jgi:hypothetical protein